MRYSWCQTPRVTVSVGGGDQVRHVGGFEELGGRRRAERVEELVALPVLGSIEVLSRDAIDVGGVLDERATATVADAMRSGRVFLAGDAAHQMPPFFGQGLCSGVRDAANLAWKLRLVVDGIAGDEVLDTYGAERLPHSAGVVAHAVDTGRLIDELSGRAAATTGLDAAYGGGRPFPILEHGIRYGNHAAVGRQLPQPMIDGPPLDELLGAGFAVVTDTESYRTEIEAVWGDLAAIVVVPTRTMPFALPAGGAVIVRPDRYVAAVAHDPSEFATASDALLQQLGVTRVTDARRAAASRP